MRNCISISVHKPFSTGWAEGASLLCTNSPRSQLFPALWQENDLEREFQIHRTDRDYALAEFWRWALALLIGVSMGVLGFLVDLGIEALNNIKYLNTVNMIVLKGM